MSFTDVDRQRIAERYPTRRRPWLAPLIAVPLVALVGFWLWLSAFHSNPPLLADVAAFEVVSDQEIRVRVLVDRAQPEVSGQCLVYAQAPDYERVGELMVPVPAADRKVEYIEVTIRTFRRSTSASVDTCSAD
mgnify:CR=1 FL=1